MSSRDLKLLGLALLPVMILCLFTYLAPIYHMPDGGYERHWRWNAPVLDIRHGYDDLKPEDIERLSKDPQQRQILEDMRNMPRTMPISPIYVGSRWGPGRNQFGYLAIVGVIAWCVFAGHKWYNR
jgi:hypothetical protein